MTLAIDQVVKEMVRAMSDVARDGAGDIKAAAQAILAAEKASLQELGEARLNQVIDDTVFDREIERERRVVEAELLTLEIMTKALAQKAVNAALEVFSQAVRAAL